jgi:putative DNA primase/helicase
MSAEHLARALGARRTGAGWIARCPAHDDREPSLSIRNSATGKVLVHCFAGCEPQRVIQALKDMGLWPAGPDARLLSASHSARPPAVHHSGPDTAAMAIRCWRTAQGAPGSRIEAYLRSRQSSIPVPPSLRFHPSLRHPSGSYWPAMIALITEGVSGRPIGVHRTFLAPSGEGKAPVDPQKMMLGPCRGGAVRLGPTCGNLLVGEGIETCLSAMQATGQSAWAALSTSGLRSLALPAQVREVIILADGDDPGEAAARDAGERWAREGRLVRVAPAPRGLDFNSVLAG